MNWLDVARWTFALAIGGTMVGWAVKLVWLQTSNLFNLWVRPTSVSLSDDANRISRLILSGEAFNEAKRALTLAGGNKLLRLGAYEKIIEELKFIQRRCSIAPDSNPVVRAAVQRELTKLRHHYRGLLRGLTVEVPSTSIRHLLPASLAYEEDRS